MRSYAGFIQVLVLSAAFLQGCGSKPTGPTAPVEGPWGAEQVGLVLTATGGRLVTPCSVGLLHEPIRPDATGAFRVQGRYAEGPVSGYGPAEFSGHIRQNQMQLFIVENDTRELLASFTLQRGIEGPSDPECL